VIDGLRSCLRVIFLIPQTCANNTAVVACAVPVEASEEPSLRPKLRQVMIAFAVTARSEKRSPPGEFLVLGNACPKSSKENCTGLFY
jgi:hypothetical protein